MQNRDEYRFVHLTFCGVDHQERADTKHAAAERHESEDATSSKQDANIRKQTDALKSCERELIANNKHAENFVARWEAALCAERHKTDRVEHALGMMQSAVRPIEEGLVEKTDRLKQVHRIIIAGWMQHVSLLKHAVKDAHVKNKEESTGKYGADHDEAGLSIQCCKIQGGQLVARLLNDLRPSKGQENAEKEGSEQSERDADDADQKRFVVGDVIVGLDRELGFYEVIGY